MEVTNKESRTLVWALLAIVILVGGYFWYTSHKQTPKVVEEKAIELTKPEGIETKMADLSASSSDRLPEGFPTKIPVEVNNVKESYKQVYNNQGVTLYTVSYTSLKNKDALWKIYTDYFARNGWSIDTVVTNQSKGILKGIKGSNEIFIVLSSSGTSSYVQLNYIEKQ